MSSHDKDKLEQDLDTLQRQYRAAAVDEPPAMLDQAVLNRARRAAEQHAIRPWSFSWMHATATAALLVLGLTLVLQVRESAQVPETLPEAVLDHIEVPAEAASEDADPESELRRNSISAFRTLQTLPKAETLREVREEALAAPEAPAPIVVVRPGHPAIAVGQGANEWDFGSRPVTYYSSAEEWLNHILGLKHSGDEAAWRSELEMFVGVFPEHPLPRELSDALLAEPALVPDSE